MILALREHETTFGVGLAQEVRDRLRASRLGLTIEPSPGAADRYDVTPGSTVGVAQFDGCTVEVRPKLPVDHVLWMLSYNVENASIGREPVGLEYHHGLLDVLVATFDRHLQAALRRGPLAGYVRTEERLPTVRGRILFEAQIRSRPGTLIPVEVAYDEFTEDIEENRRLKAALAVLRAAPIRSARLRRLLRRWEIVLQDVALVPYRVAELPEVRFTRLNEHYRAAIETADLILSHGSFDARSGRVSSFSLLFDMNKVVEDFLVTALREALAPGEREFLHGGRAEGLALDDEASVSLKPDFSWWERRRCVFVGDVKYKLGSADGSVAQADVYQMLAYCVGAGVPCGMIACLGNVAAARDLLVPNAGKRVAVRHIDVTRPARELLGAVNALAGEIRQIAVECRSGTAAIGARATNSA